MALIKCRECGKERSDQAIACPHCGITSGKAARLVSARMAVKQFAVVAVAAIFLIIFGNSNDLTLFTFLGFGFLFVGFSMLLAKFVAG